MATGFEQGAGDGDAEDVSLGSEGGEGAIKGRITWQGEYIYDDDVCVEEHGTAERLDAALRTAPGSLLLAEPEAGEIR